VQPSRDRCIQTVDSPLEKMDGYTFGTDTMPTYTYACPDCGHRFDLFHSISDNSDKLCPHCGAVAGRQIGGGSGFSMSGGGSSSSSGLSSIPAAPTGGFS